MKRNHGGLFKSGNRSSEEAVLRANAVALPRPLQQIVSPVLWSLDVPLRLGNVIEVLHGMIDSVMHVLRVYEKGCARMLEYANLF